MIICNASQILVVDDNGTMRSIVAKLLKQLGFANIDEAPSGSSALTKIREKRYDLVLSDCNMESMGGQELLDTVRADEKLSDLPFIMMTTSGTVAKIVGAKHSRVDGFIIKPFSAEDLRAKIVQVGAGA